ncbi:type II secretion system protein [Patescibacteria group bacterium]|nr:type II secretion system protein [Patescibacteria group bacterium]
MTARRYLNTGGFTLIELLVVISIVTILSGVLIPSFTTYLRRQTVKQAQQKLVSDLRTVQNKALTGTLSDQLINGTDPVAFWGIEFVNDTNDYVYFISAENTACSVARIDQERYYLNQNVNIYSAPQCIFFNMDSGDITIPGVSFDLESIEVGYEDGGAENKQVLFNPAGLIYANN